MARRTLFVVSACLTVVTTVAFRPSHSAHSGRAHRLEAAFGGDDASASVLSRRRAAGAAAAALASSAFGARAAFAAQDEKDLTRIVKGVKNIDGA